MSENGEKLEVLKWVQVPDGEYNEHYYYDGRSKVVAASDRDGESWFCNINDGETIWLESSNRDDAFREALKRLKEAGR